MDDDWNSEDEFYDRLAAIEEAIGDRDFAWWASEHESILWKMWEHTRSALQYTQYDGEFLDKARFIDFVEFVANSTSTAPVPPPQLPKPFQWNFTGTREELDSSLNVITLSKSHRTTVDRKTQSDLPDQLDDWKTTMSSGPSEVVKDIPQTQQKTPKGRYIPPSKRSNQRSRRAARQYQKKPEIQSRTEFPSL
jgi:hypothetical protein